MRKCMERERACDRTRTPCCQSFQWNFVYTRETWGKDVRCCGICGKYIPGENMVKHDIDMLAMRCKRCFKDVEDLDFRDPS